MAGQRELRIVDDGVGGLTWNGIPLDVPAGERDRLVLLGSIDTLTLVGGDSATLVASGELVIQIGDVFFDATLGTIVGTPDFILVGVETLPVGGGDVILDLYPSFRGGGALRAVLRGPSSAVASFDGGGALSALVEAVPHVAVDFGGEGVLSAAVASEGRRWSRFDGEGSLAATVVPVTGVVAGLRSEGTLWVGATADGLMAAAARAIPVSV